MGPPPSFSALLLKVKQGNLAHGEQGCHLTAPSGPTADLGPKPTCPHSKLKSFPLRLYAHGSVLLSVCTVMKREPQTGPKRGPINSVIKFRAGRFDGAMGKGDGNRGAGLVGSTTETRGSVGNNPAGKLLWLTLTSGYHLFMNLF